MKVYPPLLLAGVITVAMIAYAVIDDSKRAKQVAATIAPATAETPAAPPAGSVAPPPSPSPSPSPSQIPSTQTSTSNSPSQNDARGAKEELKAVIRHVVTAEEVYFADRMVYASSVAELGVPPFPPHIKLTFLSVGQAGYGVRGTSDQLPGIECAFFVGNAPPVRPAKQMAQVQCTDDEAEQAGPIRR